VKQLLNGYQFPVILSLLTRNPSQSVRVRKNNLINIECDSISEKIVFKTGNAIESVKIFLKHEI
jgi:hypothetical protein